MALITAGSTIAGAAASAVSIALRQAWRGSMVEESVAQKTIEDRLDELSTSMRVSARLMEEVSAELEVRAATAKKLKEEAETAEALAAIHKEQADAIRRMLDVEFASASRRIRRDSITIGIASFVAGGGVTFVISLFVHPLH